MATANIRKNVDNMSPRTKSPLRHSCGRRRFPRLVLEELEQRIVPSTFPDLRAVIENVFADPTLNAGDAFTFEGHKVNDGDADVEPGELFYHCFFLSDNNDPEVSEGDLLIPGMGFGPFIVDNEGIEAHTQGPSQSLDLYVPLDIPSGDYYLKAQIDSLNNINEGDTGGEDNNVAVTDTRAISIESDVIYSEDFEGVSQPVETYGYKRTPVEGESVMNLWYLTDHRGFDFGRYSMQSLYFGFQDPFWHYDYERHVGGHIVSPLINLQDVDVGSDATLSFTYFLETENHAGKDNATVEIITETEVFTLAGNHGEGLVDPTSTWVTWEGEIPDGAKGQVVQVCFTFDTMDAEDNVHEGWYVDDVVIRGEGANPWPDLQVDIESVAAADELVEKDTFFVNIRETNAGTWDVAPGEEFEFAYYLSLDDILDGEDLLLNAVNPDDLIEDGGLAAGATWPAEGEDPFGVELIVPDEIEAGDYYVIAVIDSGDDIHEGFGQPEANNTDITETPVLHVVYADLPDLVPTLEDVDVSGDLNYGDTFTALFRGTNSGDVDIAAGDAFSYAFYLSLDDVLDEGDIPLEAVNPADLIYDGGLATGESSPPAGSDPFSVDLIIPENIPGRDYHVIVQINSGGDIYEGYIGGENNNADATDTAPVTVIPGLPDLVPHIEGIEADETLFQDSTFIVLTRLSNIGGGDVAEGEAMHHAFYLSLDDQLDEDDILLPMVDVGYEIVDDFGLAAWESRPEAGSPPSAAEFVIPGEIESGDYYVIAVADSQNEIEEIAAGGEDNNVCVTDEASIHVIHLDDFYLADFDDITTQGFTRQDMTGTNLWHLTDHRGGDEGHSSGWSFYFAREDSPHYDTGGVVAGYLVSPVIDLIGATGNVQLSFSYFLETEGDLDGQFDHAWVEVSSGVEGEEPLVVAYNHDENLDDPTDGWVTFRGDISGFAGGFVRLSFGFDSVDAENNNYEGWLVDDIMIRGEVREDWPDLQVEVEDVEAGGAAHSGDVFTVKIRETNAGTVDVAEGEGFSLAFYLSADDQWDAGDTLVGAVNPDDLIDDLGLAAGETRPDIGQDPAEIDLILPDGVPEGDYYIIAVIDSGDEVLEGFSGGEDNNTTVTTGAVIHITDAPPTINQLTVVPSTLAQGQNLTLTALGVNDPDGTVTKVEFYRDADGNDVFDAGIDTLVATDNSEAGGWSWSGSTAGFPLGTYRCFARAQDNDSNWSVPESATITVTPPPDFEMTLTKSDGAFEFRDATNDLATILYAGNGEALIRFDGPTADGSDIEFIIITGASSSSSLYVTANSSTPVGSIEISGSGFKYLEIDGDLGELDIGITPGKKFKNLIVDGTLGDVDAQNVKKIDLIQADRLTGEIYAQEVKKLIVEDDIHGATIVAAGSKGAIKEMRVGDDVIDSYLGATKGIKKAYIDGDIVSSMFEATGDKGKLDKFYLGGHILNSAFFASQSKGKLGKFYISGGVTESYFGAVGVGGKLGKFYIAQDVQDTAFESADKIDAIYVGYDARGRALPGEHGLSGSITGGKDLSKCYITGELDADIFVTGNIKKLFAGSVGDCQVAAYGKIDRAEFDGDIYGSFYAYQIKKLGTHNGYFRDPATGEPIYYPIGQVDSPLQAEKLFNLKNIWDADGNMKDRYYP